MLLSINLIIKLYIELDVARQDGTRLSMFKQGLNNELKAAHAAALNPRNGLSALACGGPPQPDLWVRGGNQIATRRH